MSVFKCQVNLDSIGSFLLITEACRFSGLLALPTLILCESPRQGILLTVVSLDPGVVNGYRQECIPCLPCAP